MADWVMSVLSFPASAISHPPAGPCPQLTIMKQDLHTFVARESNCGFWHNRCIWEEAFALPRGGEQEVEKE